MFYKFAEKLYSAVAKIPFDYLVWFVWGSYLVIFAAVMVLTLVLPKAKGLSKRPFLSLTNAYTAVNLALFLLKCELAQSILVSVLFWVIGYILYGALCALSRHRRPVQETPRQAVVTSLPPPAAPPKTARTDIPAAKNNVRLEHAVSVTDKLLSKNLGKSDRQELEKIKNTLAVLQIKGTLSPAEADILNENFNTILKLMAKYNV